MDLRSVASLYASLDVLSAVTENGRDPLERKIAFNDQTVQAASRQRHADAARFERFQFPPVLR